MMSTIVVESAESPSRVPLGPVVQFDEGRIEAHLDEVVRSTVEETPNALLDAEADGARFSGFIGQVQPGIPG